MRICTTLALALAVTVAVGCKKKKEDDGGTVTKPEGSGSSGMAGSGSGMAGSGSAQMAEKPLVGAELAQRYLTCTGYANAGDWDKFKDCQTTDFKVHDAGMGEDMVGNDKVVDMFKGMKEGFPDAKLEPQMVFVNGRSIAAIGLMTGTHSGDMPTPAGPMKATNKKMGMLYFHRLKINDANKATEEFFIDDSGTMMAQLGMAPKELPGRPLMDKPMDGAPVLIIAADDDKEKANLATFAKGTEAFNAHKAADMVAIMTDDAVESDQAEPKDTVGKKDITAGTEMFLNGFSDSKIDVWESWAAGDFVVGIAKFSGTNDHDMGKAMKKTGKHVDIEYAEVAQFKDGKISRLWRFRNAVAMGMQLGMKMPEMAGGGGGSGSAAAGSGEKTQTGLTKEQAIENARKAGIIGNDKKPGDKKDK